jgi:iron complex transport system substrate-binding protein
MFKLITKLFVIQIIFLLSVSCSSSINYSSKNESIPLNPIPPVTPVTPVNINTIYKTKPALIPIQPLPNKETNKFKLIEPKQPKLATKKITNSKKTKAIPSTSYPLIITGSNEKNIIFKKSPKKIIAFDSAAVEIIYEIGAGDKIIGTHSFVNFPESVNNIEKVGDAFNLNIESVINLEPDLFYIFFEQYIDQLENNKIQVLYQKSLNGNFESIPERIIMWGKILNKNQEALNSANSFKTRLNNIKIFFNNYSGGPTVFYDTGSLWTPGHDTLIGQTLDLLKLHNIAKDISGYKQYSKELIIQKNPQIIITSSPEYFANSSEFKNLTAVKNKRIITINQELLSVAGPRFIDGIEELGVAIYSPIFNKILLSNIDK